MFVLPTVVRRPGQRIDPRGDVPDDARRAVQPAVEAFQSHGDDQLARVQPPGAQQLSAALGAPPLFAVDEVGSQLNAVLPKPLQVAVDEPGQMP
jgi:hypothetical protein